MLNNIKVSIITVVYNGAKTIEQTIKSVLGQTYKNIEYIIIDGMSEDGTQEIVNRYKDNIAYFVSEKDLGIYDAMNKGIKWATGDIIGLINSDDWYEIDAVENVVRVFGNEDVDVVYGEMELVHIGGYTSKTKNGELEQILYRMVVPHPTAFVRKEVYDQIGLFNLQYKIAADYDLFLRMYLQNVRLRQVAQVLAYFREGGVSTEKIVECADEARKIAQYYARRRNDFETLGKIEKYYQTRIRSALTKEKMCRIIKSGKNIQTILNEIKGAQERKISIFGAGNLGVECFLFLQEMKIEVECFYDNDQRKWNTSFLGKNILKCTERKSNADYIIVAVMNYQKEIVDQLKNVGYQMNEDFCVYDYLIDEIESRIG